MKDWGESDVILGIKISKVLIHKITNGIVLSQSHCIKNVLKKYDKYDGGLAKTPVAITLHLAKKHGQSIYQLEYYKIIGSLMYISNCTRPDITYAVH